MEEALNQAAKEVEAAGTFAIVILELALLVCAILGAIVGSQKRAGLIGGILGFLLGPLGVLVAAFVDRRLLCPRCGGRLNGEPRLCPACQSALEWLDGRPCIRIAAARRPPKVAAADPAEDPEIERVAAAALGGPGNKAAVHRNPPACPPPPPLR